MPPLPVREIALRSAVNVGGVAAILAGLWWSGAVTPIWHATLIGVATFYLLVHVAPEAIFRLQSMPYTYQARNNFGPRAFELQNLTYAAYHTHWYNHATHAAFPLEAFLWLLVATHFGGPLACAALAALLVAQVFSFGERRFAVGVSALWLAMAAAAVATLRAFGAEAYPAAQLGLVGLGFWRFTGHWVEPLPPGVVGNRAFVALRETPLDWRLLRPMLFGYLSEFSAGLPFRLVSSWFFVVAQQLGYRPEGALSWEAARVAAAELHRSGWSAHPTTAAVVTAARALEPAPARARGIPPLRSESREFAIRLLACDQGASVWLIAIAGRTLLFDAWFDDPYVSGSQRFFEGHRIEPPRVSVDTLPPLDAIVLSSAEQDHAHPRTLARLDPRVPVFARREAAQIAASAGFESVTALAPGVPQALFGGAVSALALPGYGRNLAILLRDDESGERVCIAQHGIQERWLARNASSVFRWQFAPDAAGRLVDTLCLGVHTTRLGLRGVPSWLLGDAAMIVPDPAESAAAVARLSPRRVLFSHCTPEAETGFAVRHLLSYPNADDDVGHAARVLGVSCPGVSIAGLPAPAVWV